MRVQNLINDETFWPYLTLFTSNGILNERITFIVFPFFGYLVYLFICLIIFEQFYQQWEGLKKLRRPWQKVRRISPNAKMYPSVSICISNNVHFYLWYWFLKIPMFSGFRPIFKNTFYFLAYPIRWIYYRLVFKTLVGLDYFVIWPPTTGCVAAWHKICVCSKRFFIWFSNCCLIYSVCVRPSMLPEGYPCKKEKQKKL